MVIHIFPGTLGLNSPIMRVQIRQYIRESMKTNGFNYRALAGQLTRMGVRQSDSNLRSKINNGTFDAQLLIFILIALNVDHFDVRLFADQLEQSAAKR